MGEITAGLCEQWIEAVEENGYRYGDELIAILRAHAAAIREAERDIGLYANATDDYYRGVLANAKAILTILRGQQP